MDNECINFSIDKNSLLEDIGSPCEINGKEFAQVSTEPETLISAEAMDISTTPLISSIELPSFSTPTDLQTLETLPTSIQEGGILPHMTNNSFLLETICEPEIVISDPVLPPSPSQAVSKKKPSEFLTPF